MSDLPSNLVITVQGSLVIWNELRTCTGGGGGGTDGRGGRGCILRKPV